MFEDTNKPDQFTDLRRQAETMARDQWLDPTVLSADDIRRLIHELQVHQIELELQNEELRRAQAALEASRDRYSDLYDFAPVGYLTLNEKGLIIEANLTITAMLGLTRDSLLNRALTSFIAKEDQEQYYLYHQQPFDAQTPRTCEIRLERADHSQFYALIEAIKIRHKGSRTQVYQMVISNITERKLADLALRESNQRLEQTLTELKESQAKLMQQERLAAVGQLAAGIAHDFNNILTTMMGFAELLQTYPDTPELVRVNLGHILTAGQRAVRLVQQILDFSHKSIRRPQPLDLVTFTQEVVNFLSHTIPENVHLSLNAEPGTYLVEADPAQLQQLLTNLAVNARDAMPGGGDLQILLARVKIKNGIYCVGCNQAIGGEWVRLTITDTGSGIPSTILPHIFEPFFSTKKTGEGSGLGLAQAIGIVEQHVGHITVDSQEGRGTTFAIFLPPLTAPQDHAAPAETKPVLSGHGETILLVEDEPLVLEATRGMLAYLGYQVLTAQNGTEALALYSRHRHEIALILSDMVMPDMEGVVLFDILKGQTPALKMVMMSGYPLGQRGAKLLRQGVVNWIQKPTLLADLSQVISQALAR